MASIAKLSVQMAWQGSEVTKGAADASKDLKKVADNAKKTKNNLFRSPMLTKIKSAKSKSPA